MSKCNQNNKSPNKITVVQNAYYDPHHQRELPKQSKLSKEQFIKQWVHKIFYNEQKIDPAAQCAIYRRLIKQKSYQLSCSNIYSIIRDHVKQIALRLRKFIDFSHSSMVKQHKDYCSIGVNKDQWNSSWQQMKNQKDADYLKLIYPITSKIYIFSFVYMCQISKEVVKLWKVLTDCTHVKDIKINTIELRLKEIINEIFTQQTDSFKPKQMLPIILKAYNIKNITSKAVCQNYSEISFLQNSDLISNLKCYTPAIVENKKLNQKKTFKDINEKFYKRLQKNFSKNRMDYKHLQQIKKFYLQNEDILNDSRQLKRQKFMIKSQQIKNQLIKSFDFRKQLIFELEDNSSFEDDQQFMFVDNIEGQKQNLIEEHDNVEIQIGHHDYKQFIQNRQTEQSSKLSSSSGTEEVTQHFQLTMKNYEKQPTPPQLIYCQEMQEEKQIVNQNIKLIAKQCNNIFQTQLTSQFNEKLMSEKDFNQGVYEKMTRLKLKICKSKENMLNQRKIEQLDKKKLQEQKDKLQKYRKQLEKQKQQLLRQVQRFMKQKKKQEKHSSRQEHKFISIKRYNCTINIQKNLIKHQSNKEKFDQMITDSQKIKQIQEAIQKDIVIQQENKKMSKKQQKNKKRKERQASAKNINDQAKLMQSVNSLQHKDKNDKNQILFNLKEYLQSCEHQRPVLERKQTKNEHKYADYNQKELALNELLQNFQVNNDERVSCNIQQAQINRWRKKMQDLFHNISIKPDESKTNYSLLKNEPIVIKKKKKNKNRT